MNLLALTPDFYPKETGYSIACQNLYKALIDNNIAENIIVASPYSEIYDYKNRISSFQFGYPRGRSILFRLNGSLAIKYYMISMRNRIKSLLKLCEDNRIDLIFIESLEWGWFSYILSKKTNIPIITRIHGTLPEYTVYTNKRSFREKYIKYAFKTKNIATTTYHYIDFFQDYFKSFEPFFDKNFFIIPNTLDLYDYKFEKEKNEEEIVFFQLGRMDELGYHQKGFEDTLQAFTYLENTVDKSILKKVRYIAIGDGGKASVFEKKIKRLNYINIEYYKSKSNKDVKEILKKADVVLMPSRAEGMSMFATEALAYGKAFVYTENNGLRDMIIDEYNGIKMRNYDYLQLSDAMFRYIQNTDLCVTHGNNSRKLFEKEFSYSAVSKKFNVASILVRK